MREGSVGAALITKSNLADQIFCTRAQLQRRPHDSPLCGPSPPKANAPLLVLGPREPWERPAVYNSTPMICRHPHAVLLLSLLFYVSLVSPPVAAQSERDLLATARVFPEIGAGVTAVKRDTAGRYYVLVSRAASVAVFGPTGERTGQIPAAPTKETSLLHPDDLAVDAAGRVYVAERGSNLVKVFNPDGTLAQKLSLMAPTSVVALPAGEVAVASMKAATLVTVFDDRGKIAREFGEPAEVTERGELNRYLNIGRLASDAADHIYYSFSYLPEPTVRKYDRYGYARLELDLSTPEFLPAAQAARREIARQERGGTPQLKPIITAVGVDPDTQEIWVALGPRLLHFDRDGRRRGSYRTFTADGTRVEAAAILVEPQRLLIASDTLGIFEFPHPTQAARPAPTNPSASFRRRVWPYAPTCLSSIFHRLGTAELKSALWKNCGWTV